MRYLVLCDWPSSSNYHNEIIQGIENYCKKKGFSLLTMSVGFWESNFYYEKSRYQLYNLINHQEFDGIISFSATISRNSNIKKFYNYIRSMTDLPIVHLIGQVPGSHSIVFDNKTSFLELLHHLCRDHGYRDFAYISGGLNNSDGVSRLEYVKQVFQEYNIPLPEERIFYGEWDLQSGTIGYHTLKEFNPRVIICANDFMALGVYNEALKDGLNIPSDLVITGYDNISADGFHDLPFTTVEQPFSDMGERGSVMLDKLIHHENVDYLEIIPTNLIIKESCGCWFQDNNHQEEESVQEILKDAKSSMDQAIIDEMDHPERNHLVRNWSKLVQQLVKQDMSERKILGLFNKLLLHWQRKFSDKKTLIFLNQRISILEKIINDHINQHMLSSAKKKKDQLGLAHIESDAFNEKVIVDLKLEHKGDLLQRIFLSVEKLSAYIILFKAQEGKKDFSQGELYFAMMQGEIIDTQDFPGISLEKELLTKDLWPKDFSSLLIQVLFVRDELFGYILYDYQADQADLNDYLYRSISRTLKALETAHILQYNNQCLEKEISLRIESEKNPGIIERT
ncbi:MAG: substrate-binding domain-containing protein [Spirochaetaceae bacterium]|jgi:DNA-binding LacI/PurR family transcriptional regulator|nr:substrate-binding domain-containing protein [Spirochaetaceae bacterium]